MSKKFTSDFKRECVELVTIQGYTTKQVAENMNVGYSSLQKWVRQYRAEQLGVTPNASALTPDQIRIQELEKKLKQAESDNALLKKASEDSSHQSNSYTKILNCIKKWMPPTVAEE